MTQRRGLISFDVEEWFHVLDSDAAPAERCWGDLPSRAPEIVRRLLGLLADSGSHATFFVLGWFARTHPGLVRQIATLGHEVASHSNAHPLLYEMTPRAMAEELRIGKDVLEQTIGTRVAGFRAPGFSIRGANAWALDEIVKAGFLYDSSVFPAVRAHGGMPGAASEPHLLRTPSGALLPEIPVSTVRLLGRAIPFGGGGYLRLAPLWLTIAFARALERRGLPFVSYVHPRDIDRDTPRLKLGPWRSFKSYVGLGRSAEKLVRLLREYRPVRYVDYIRERGWMEIAGAHTRGARALE